jgi:ribosomal protein L11
MLGLVKFCWEKKIEIEITVLSKRKFQSEIPESPCGVLILNQIYQINESDAARLKGRMDR